MNSGNQEELPIEITHYERKNNHRVYRNQRDAAITASTEHLSLSFIYTAYLHPTLKSFMAKIGQYIFFPLLILIKGIGIVFAWRQYYLDRERSSLANASVETITALALLIAVIGGFITSAISVLATPIVFTAVSALKTIYHAGKTLFYSIATCLEDVPEKKTLFKNEAKASFISTIGNALGTAATLCVFLLGKSTLAAIGIAATVFGVVFSIYYAIKAHRASQKKAPLAIQPEESDDTPQNTLTIHKSLNTHIKKIIPSESNPQKDLRASSHIENSFLNTPSSNRGEEKKEADLKYRPAAYCYRSSDECFGKKIRY